MPKDLATQNTGSGRGGAPRRACLPRGGAAVAAALRQIDARRFRPQPSHRLYKLAPESAASESSVLSAHLPPRSGRSCLFPFLDSRELRPGAAEMAAESCVPQPLFGGAISSTFPARFQVRGSHSAARLNLLALRGRASFFYSWACVCVLTLGLDPLVLICAGCEQHPGGPRPSGP